MTQGQRPVRVLYSFPHKLGADRICYTAWQQVNGLAKAGADVLVYPGVLHRPVPPTVCVNPTLAWGKLRLPYRLLGMMRTCALHDHLVARRLEKLKGEIDIVHAWPMGALETLKVARRLSIPSVLERPNAHTRFAYEVVQKECERLGVALPMDDTHAYKPSVLCKEEDEYRQAFRLLCPSDFVLGTFLNQGTPRDRLVAHTYGFDESRFYPAADRKNGSRKFTMLFAGTCAVRKGVHYALEAWLQSPAHRTGTFLIAGEFLPSYAEKLSKMLCHPSVRVLGHRNDIPELMRSSDVLILPTIEEGSPLVCLEAMGSGCVPLVSDVCIGACRHMETALVHAVGDVETLTRHITLLNDDRNLLQRLRSVGLNERKNFTWDAAGVRLLDAYRETIDMYRRHEASNAVAVNT
jgi:glycosyltransferase involved in cell wall biosynthesis